MPSAASYLVERIGGCHWLVTVEAHDMISDRMFAWKAHAWTRRGAHRKGGRMSDALHARIRNQDD